MVIEQSQSIPVAKGWPLLGILPKLFDGRDPFEYLKNVMLEQGDLVQINFGPKPVYLVSNADYIQRILRDNYQNYRKPDMFYKLGKQVTGNGLLISSGDFWLRQRRMIQPHLHRKQLEGLFADMVAAITETFDSWGVTPTNSVQFELSEKMGELVGNIITSTMFGKGLLSQEEITDISERLGRIFMYAGETIYSSVVPDWFPIPGQREFERDLSQTHEKVHQIVTKCRQDKDASASLIQMLLNTVDEESHEQMTEQQLLDEAMTIILAGYETTGKALTWLGVVIQKYPEVLEKLHAEINQVVGTRTPSFEDIPRLTYMRQVFMEILRMYTVTPFLPRALNQADRLGNHHLPAEALVLVFYHGVHHNPRYWDNPEVFDPERFTPERTAGRHAFAFVPFSAGPRKCAGEDFALLESSLIMAMMLQKYDLNILPNQNFDARMGGTMFPGHGVNTIFSIRASA